jgi:uncharacterized membrane protein SpoIIM required for sporulation
MFGMAILKLLAGFMIGKCVGTYCAKNELSPILGIALTVGLVLLSCVIIDKGFANG